jgi:hypothetical protein
MSLATMLTQAAQDLALAVPTSFIGNTDETATRLVAAAQYEGQALARRPENGWVVMITEYDFTTAATANNIPGTTSNVGGFAVVSGLTLANQVQIGTWQGYGTGLQNNSIVTNVVNADPNSVVTLSLPPSSTGTGTYTFGQSDYPLPSDYQRALDNTMWDRARFWAMRGPQSPQQWQLYKSSVIGRASIQRRYRFIEIEGAPHFSIDPVPTDNGSQLVFEYVSNAWCESDTGTHQTQWEADTDVGILDEYLMGLGVRWRMMRRLGFSYAEERDEYDRECMKAMAKDGAQAILDLTPSDVLHLIGPFQVQESNFPGGGFT